MDNILGLLIRLSACLFSTVYGDIGQLLFVSKNDSSTYIFIPERNVLIIMTLLLHKKGNIILNIFLMLYKMLQYSFTIIYIFHSFQFLHKLVLEAYSSQEYMMQALNLNVYKQYSIFKLFTCSCLEC